MSKSKGNVVDPFDQISLFGLDPLRYFLLKEGSLYHNGGTEPSGLKLNLDVTTMFGACMLHGDGSDIALANVCPCFNNHIASFFFAVRWHA